MSNIKCYGLHWRYEFVELDKGRIYGWKHPGTESWAHGPEEHEVDHSNQIGVYALQDADRNIVYIGQVGSGQRTLSDRLWNHTRNSRRGRWSHFSWFGLRNLDKDSKIVLENGDDSAEREEHLALNELEALMITLIEPPLNKQGGRWGCAMEYLQFSYYEGTSNRDLWDRMSKKRLRKVLKK